MIMLFSHSETFVREEATISGMKDGQSLGQACLRICHVSTPADSHTRQGIVAQCALTCTRTKLSLLRYPFSLRMRVSSEEISTVTCTMKFLIPDCWSAGRAFHRV